VITPWLSQPYPKPDSALRIVCFAYAGGSASVYRPWASLLPPDVELLAVQLPGREGRFVEPCLTRLDDVLDRLLPVLRPWLDRPFVLFGHSLGALLAFETARALRRARWPQPGRLIVSGRIPPQMPMTRRAFHDLPDAELLREVRRFNSASTSLLDDPGMASLALPILRGDFALHDTYSYREEPPLDIPFSVFGGVADDTTAVDKLKGWQVQSTRRITVNLFPGDHFFIESARNDVLSVLGQLLTALVEQSEPVLT